MIKIEHIKKMQEESLISLEVLELANVKSFTDEESMKHVGVPKAGLAFPYYDKNSKYQYARLRKDVVDVEEGRYHQPKGSKALPYFVRANIVAIYNDKIPLVITEGEKKALSFYSNFIHKDIAIYAVVASSGCYGFFKKDENGNSILSEGFDDMPVKGRRVLLIPDSDYFLNRRVKKAYNELITFLSAKGALIELIDLRNEEDEKLGLDDFLVKYGVTALQEKMQKPVAIINELLSDGSAESSTKEVESETEQIVFPQMTGLMKVLYDWVLETSPIKQPILTYGSVFAILGTVLSNLYCFINAHPVFYIMFVSRSGSGKDRPLKVAKIIFSDEELKDYRGLGGYRSDASIIDLLPKQRSRIDILDEVDSVLKISKSENGYQSGIINVLTEIWSENDKFYPGRRTKTEGVFGACWNPCLNIISALTPTAFRENFTKSMMLTGFGGRFLYFIANNNFDYTDNFVGTDMNKVPEEILIPLKHWHNLKEYDDAKKRFIIQPLGYSSEAKELLNTIRKEYYMQSMALNEEDPLSPVLQRTYENLERLLVVHTCAQEPFNPSPIVQVENVKWCKEFLDALNRNNRFFLTQNVVASQFELAKTKILQPIVNAGPNGIWHSKLLKNSHIKAKDMEEIIRTLEESNQVLSKEIKNRKVYFYIEGR